MKKNNDNRLNEYHKENRSLIDGFTKFLLDKLVEKNILKSGENSINTLEKYYMLSEDFKNLNNQEENSNIIENARNRIIEFKNIILNILSGLSITSDDFISLLKSNKDRIIYLSLDTILNIESIMRFKDNDTMFADVEIAKKLDADIKNINKYSNDILEFFTSIIAETVFNNFNFKNESNNLSPDVDFIGYSNNDNLPNILIEVKFRRRNIGKLNELFLQSIEFIKMYDSLKKKNHVLILVLFSNTSKDIRYFQEKFDELIPKHLIKYRSRIRIVLISLDSLYKLREEFENISRILFSINTEINSLSIPQPFTIKENEKYHLSSDLIKSQIGTFSIWINVPPTKELLQTTKNNRYIIGHDTNNGNRNPHNKKYINAFGFCLTPNPFNAPAKSVYWRLWLTNNQGEMFDRRCKDWIVDFPAWHLFVLRWDHNNNNLNFSINGVLQFEMKDYINFWPKSFIDSLYIGNWVDLNQRHHLNMPLFRMLAANAYLDDNWVQNELNNKPSF